MRIVVVGPGALGCLFTSLLSKGLRNNDDHLWLLDHKPDRAEQINSQGLIYEIGNRREQIPVLACSDPTTIGYADAVLLCVKSYDLKSTIEMCRKLLGPSTLLLFLQNGIAHLKAEYATCGAVTTLGTSSEGATLVDTGVVRHCGSGLTSFGFLEPPPKPAQTSLDHFVQALSSGGIQAETTDTIIDRLWAKLFVNVGINALTAIHGVANGGLLESETLKEKMREAINEACAVAKANQITIAHDPLQMTYDICKKTAENRSSMFQDTRNKRRTEIDAINGVVVNEGKQLGIDTPVNEELVEKIKAIEKGYLA